LRRGENQLEKPNHWTTPEIIQIWERRSGIQAKSAKTLLIQVVNFDQADAGGVVQSAHNGGVVAGREDCENG